MRGIILRSIGAIAASLVASGAPAAVVQIELEEIRYGGGLEYISAGLSGTLTGSYDDVANTVTMDTGTITAEYRLNPFTVLYWHYMDDAAWDLDAGSASFAAWSCVDGPFGASVGASLCGNISGGGDFVVQSTLDYSTIPGTRSIVGDDVVIGPMQQGADYDALLGSWAGGQLIIETSTWSESGTTDSPTGYQLVFTQVPVPAAAWLFGSALGLLGWMRRKAN